MPPANKAFHVSKSPKSIIADPLLLAGTTLPTMSNHVYKRLIIQLKSYAQSLAPFVDRRNPDAKYRVIMGGVVKQHCLFFYNLDGSGL